MHALEKMLARAAGLNEVTTGEIITVKVDLAGVNDLYLQVLKSFFEMGGEKVWNPDKVAFFLDHYIPAPTIQSAANQKEMREFCWDQGIKNLFDINTGVCHQIIAEHGLVRPGMVLVVTDSHTTIHGAFGALGTGVGATDLACILISGEIWMKVPSVIKVNLHGRLPHGVYAKDVVLHVIGQLGADAAVYKAVEYTGEAVKSFSIAERMTICNMTTEMGAKTSYIEPDQTTLDYVRARTNQPFVIDQTDAGYQYEAVYDFDVSRIVPGVAAPHSVDNYQTIREAEGVHVDQALIGTCTGGRVEDIAIAAEILKGKRIHPRTRLVIMPASQDVLTTSIEKGYIQTLLAAGATLTAPGCGPCLGTHQGLLAPGEVCVTTSSRNFPGRMGSTGAKIYVASPATVAAAALEGHLADPIRYLNKEAK